MQEAQVVQKHIRKELPQIKLAQNIRGNNGKKVYKTVIPRNIRLTEAPSYGKPILLYDKDSIGAKKYEELVGEILGVSLDISSLDILSKRNQEIEPESGDK